MTSAHRFWHLDSRHLLYYLTATVHKPATRRRRELLTLLASTMLRRAGLDWYEQGDVWARVAAHRDPPDHLSTGQRRTLQDQVRRLMSVDTRTLADSGPLTGTPSWTAAYETAGRELAHLNAEGRLRRGLRDVLAHQIIFAANRLGVPATTQAALANTATAVVFGDAPAPPRAATDHTHDQMGTGSTTTPGRRL
jgi:thiopeptide-type bacteriocin biosynthesis protein